VIGTVRLAGRGVNAGVDPAGRVVVIRSSLGWQSGPNVADGEWSRAWEPMVGFRPPRDGEVA
jgi:hypothetical protein